MPEPVNCCRQHAHKMHNFVQNSRTYALAKVEKAPLKPLVEACALVQAREKPKYHGIIKISKLLHKVQVLKIFSFKVSIKLSIKTINCSHV